MHTDTENPNMNSSKHIDGHKLSEFVYGTVAGMVATSGMNGSHNVSWAQAASIIIVGSAAIWLAHAYSILLGHRIASKKRVTGGDLGNVLSGSWPIVVAGIVLSIPLIGVPMDIWSLSTALRVSGFMGLAILALVGILAGVVSRETWPRRLLLATLSTALGIMIIVVELIAHH